MDELGSLSLLSEMKELLVKIAEQSSPASPPGLHFVDGTPRGSINDLRLMTFTFGCSAAAVVTLNIGTRAYLFNVKAGDTVTVPFPFALKNGVDVSVSASAGNLSSCYFTYQPGKA